METATASFDAGEELEDLGLSRQFYDTQFDFPKFQADEYADKFLLGVSVRTRRPRTESSTPSTRTARAAPAPLPSKPKQDEYKGRRIRTDTPSRNLSAYSSA